MRKKVSYDRKYLKEELNYSQVPVRQILSLNIKPFEQLLLIQLFSHTDTWGVSFNQISKSFYCKKNRNDIKKGYESLKTKGYLKETDSMYLIILTKIQQDYESFLKRCDSSVNRDRNDTIDSSTTSIDDSPTNRGVIVPLSVGDSSTTSLIDSSTNTNNIIKNKKEKNQITTSTQTGTENIAHVSQISDIPNQNNSDSKTSSLKEITSNSASKKIIVQSESNSSSPQIPSFHFSPNEIQTQIDDYNNSESKYFTVNNQNLVSNSFTEYYNQYPKTKMTITKYEQVLYAQLLQTSMQLDGITLNEHLMKHPISINPADIHNLIRSINDKSEVQEIFKKLIEKVNYLPNDNN